jgi:hypothetical protein
MVVASVGPNLVTMLATRRLLSIDHGSNPRWHLHGAAAIDPYRLRGTRWIRICRGAPDRGFRLIPALPAALLRPC